MKERKQKNYTNPSSKSKLKVTIEVERQQANSQNVHPQDASSQDASSQDSTQKETTKSHWAIIIIPLLAIIIIMILAIILYKMNPDLCMSVVQFLENFIDFLKEIFNFFERYAGRVKLRIFTECLIF